MHVTVPLSEIEAARGVENDRSLRMTHVILAALYLHSNDFCPVEHVRCAMVTAS